MRSRYRFIEDPLRRSPRDRRLSKGERRSKMRPALQPLQVCLNHFGGQLLERDRRRPAELTLSLARIAEQDLDLRGAQEFRVDDDMVGGRETDMRKGEVAKGADRCIPPGRDDIVVRRVLL